MHAKSFPAGFAGVFAAILCASALIMPSAAAEGAAEGIRLCLSTVVPSLFMLMFVSVLLTECGVMGLLSRLLSGICAKLFGLSGCSGAAVIAALLGGYPAGAKTVNSMYEKNMISEEEARLLPLFCFGAGPAFILGVVGAMTSAREAVLLLIVQFLSVLICGATVCRLSGLKTSAPSSENKKYEDMRQIRIQPYRTLPEKIVASVDGTAGAMLNICLYAVLFCSLRAMLDRSGASAAVISLLTKAGAGRAAAEAAVPVLLEVTSGSAYACRAGLPAAAFALGFGGLSVHMQVYGICRRPRTSPLRFTLARLYQAAVSALLTGAFAPLLHAAGPAAPVSGQPVHRLTSGCPAGAVTLVVMCIMWTLFIDGPYVPKHTKLQYK